MSPEATTNPRFGGSIRVASWGAVLAWMGVIFWLSSKTGIKVWNPMTYVAHFAEYLILGLLLCLALHLSATLDPRRLLLVALIVASLYGLSDELHQGFVPTREVSVWDWLTDTAGAAAAVLVWSGMLRAWMRRGAIRSG